MLSMYGLQSPLPLHAHTSTGSARPRLGPARFRIAAAAAETTVKRGRGRPKKSVAPTEEVAAPVKPPVKQKKKEPIVLLDDTDSEDSFSEPNVKHEEQVVNEDEDEDAEENEDDENEVNWTSVLCATSLGARAQNIDGSQHAGLKAQ